MDRQRTILLFAAAAAMAALLSWFLYANTVAPKQEQRTAIFAAAHDLAIGQAIRKADVRKISLRPQDIPKGAVFAEGDVLGRVALYPVSANAPLIRSSISSLAGADGIPATIEPGFRAVSVTITDVSGVAGLIQPGSHVDVLFTRPGSMVEAITSTILQNVRVLAIGRLVQAGQTVDPKAPKMPVATLVVTPGDAQKLELAKNQGRISLSLRNPLDKTAGVDGRPVNTEILDPTQHAKIVIAEKRQTTPAVMPAPVRVPPPPPPPPHAVIDVFRGDKHVQEVFHD